MVADELIKQRTNADFVRQVINDESKTALVLDTIDSAIATPVSYTHLTLPTNREV